MIMYNPGNVLGRYNTRLMAFDGVYGEYNPEEAFATSVSNFVRHPNSMKEKYPEAYNAIKALFDASPSARDYVERIMNEYRRAFIK
jgi:Mlc titration factor MtfA (ptsG expression regulator)